MQNTALVATTALPVAPSATPTTPPALVYLAALASKSRQTMRWHLDSLATALSNGERDALTYEWHRLTYAHTQAIRSLLAEKYAPATANLALSALKGTLKECWRLGLMNVEDCERACDLKPIKSQRLPKGRAIKGEELSALLQVCTAGANEGANGANKRANSVISGVEKTQKDAIKHAISGLRDAALLAVLYGCGLRRQEAAGLDLSDYDPDTGALVVRMGKGRKERVVYAGDDVAELLHAWLEHRGPEEGPLFVPITRTGTLQWRRMTGQAVYNILAKRAAEAGVKEIAPHDLRRSFCSSLLSAGADIATVSKLMGHASLVTTQRYDKRGDEAKRQAANLLRLSDR